MAKTASDVQSQEIQFDRNGLISLHTNELDVRQLLELLSRRSGMNILVSPKVSGTITANFEKVTIQELLSSILKLADLVEKVEGGIHFIYSKEETRDVTETAKKERIVTKVYRLNYIRADELMVMISPFLSNDVGKKRFATSANYQFGISESSTLSTGGAGGGAGGSEVLEALGEPSHLEEQEQSSEVRSQSQAASRWPATTWSSSRIMNQT